MIETSKQDAVELRDIPFVDWRKVQSLVEKVSRDPDHELKVRFVRTVFSNLDNILKRLADESSPLPERLSSLLESLQAIEDMAMINGYEGVETIARNVRLALTSVDPRTERTLSTGLARKIAMAVEAIQKILEFSDALNERLLVDSTTSDMTELEAAKPVTGEDQSPAKSEEAEEHPKGQQASSATGHDGAAQPEPQSTEEEQISEEGDPLDELLTLAGEDEEETGEPLFDIREASELLELMAEGEAETDEPTRESGATEEDASAAQGDDGQDLRELFADVLRGEIRETVAALSKIARSETTVSTGHVDNAMFVLEGLAETADKLRDRPLADLSRTLISYISSKPKIDSLASPDSKQLLEQAIRALEAYAQDPVGASDRLEMVSQRLRDSAGQQEEEETDIFDDALLAELQKKLDRGELDESSDEAGIKGKLRRIFGLG